jgi:tetratricopeptide (TPR) repeat protein
MEREDKAKRIIQRQLFHSTEGAKDDDENKDNDEQKWKGPERDPGPADAPRLWSILGDIEHEPARYERAWEISGGQYARAQRSLGRLHYAARNYDKAVEAYEKSLHVNRLSHQVWFALGCIKLEMANWDGAIEAFSRTVQLDEYDAESWSNLAAALIRRSDSPATSDSSSKAAIAPPVLLEDEEDQRDADSVVRENDLQKEKDRNAALRALRHASSLQPTSYRILSNLLTVASSVSPPSYADILNAQRQLINLQGATEGEKCIDIDIIEGLVRHVILLSQETTPPASEGVDPAQRGLGRLVVELVEKDVVPLITTSARLWKVVARLAVWRHKPTEAMAAQEKAWRAVVGSTAWEAGTEAHWDEVVEATGELVDAYESLSETKEWRFKARSAVRGVMGRGKDSWEGTSGWEKLKERLEELKVST